jgi:hypothetical protein
VIYREVNSIMATHVIAPSQWELGHVCLLTSRLAHSLFLMVEFD